MNATMLMLLGFPLSVAVYFSSVVPVETKVELRPSIWCVHVTIFNDLRLCCATSQSICICILGLRRDRWEVSSSFKDFEFA